MKNVLEFILKHITEFPDEIVIDEQISENNRIVYNVRCNQADMAKVIGKQGRIIRAVRDIVKLAATKKDAYVDVVLSES